MSDTNGQEFADAFGLETDPLAKYAHKFEEIDADPFDFAFDEVLANKGLSDGAITSYNAAVRDWCEFMTTQGRHPACPNPDHITRFVRMEIEPGDSRPEHDTTDEAWVRNKVDRYWRNGPEIEIDVEDGWGNSRRTAKKKLWNLNSIYTTWQRSSKMPHPTEYNPFLEAKQRLSLSTKRVKEPPRISVEDLRDVVAEVKHIRDRAFIVTQLKLGLRASEMANIKISEIDIANREVARHYDDLGTSPHVERFENAVYIPHDREGNKSKRPRILPIDDELRRLWINYLLIRPEADEPWLFLSRTNHTKVDDEVINNAWKRHFHPEYEENQQHRAVTSHYGRHRFTTYWRVEEDVNRELIKYMRGDTSAGGTVDPAGGIDHYIHSYYEDIEPLYRERIYKFGV
jgi:integrase/recombinase XerD